MNLFIQTTTDGNPIADKTVAAVTSMTDLTAVEDLGNLVLGDSEPLVIKFTNGTTTPPSFAGDSNYGISVAIGSLSVDGSLNYTSTSSFDTITAGWSGRIALTTAPLISAVQWIAGGPFNNVFASANIGGNFGLQIRVTTPSGYTATYALLQVFIEWRVGVSSTPETENAAFAIGPSENAQASTEAGTLTIAPESQIHTETVTVTGLATTRNIVVTNPTGLSPGARIDLVVLFPLGATNNTVVNVYAESTGGSLLFSFTRSGDEPNALFVIYRNKAGSLAAKNSTVPAFYA